MCAFWWLSLRPQILNLSSHIKFVEYYVYFSLENYVTVLLTQVGDLDSSQTQVTNFVDLRLDLTWTKMTCDLTWLEQKWLVTWLDLSKNDVWLDLTLAKMTCDLTWLEKKWLGYNTATSLQRELFPTMFYTINLSPLLVIKKGFMLIIILSKLIMSTAFNIRKVMRQNCNCKFMWCTEKISVNLRVFENIWIFIEKFSCIYRHGM